MEATGYNRAPFPTDKAYGVQNAVRCIEHTGTTTYRPCKKKSGWTREQTAQ